MSDSFVQLRNGLLQDKPSLRKFVPQKKFKPPQPYKRKSIKTSVPSHNPSTKDPEGFVKVNPNIVNNEEDIFEHRGKKYKKVFYGSKQDFLVHKGLNPPNKYTAELCADELHDLENKHVLTQASRLAKAKEATLKKNILGEQSEARRDSLKNMESYKLGVVDDLVKQNRAKTKLILANAERALVDNQEEMRKFYSHVGSTQVLAMRELQIEDHKHFKEAGIENGEIFFKGRTQQDGPSEYEELVQKKKESHEKNIKIIDVLRSQILEKEKKAAQEMESNLKNAERIAALAEAEKTKKINEHEEVEKERQKHYDTFNNIVNYRDYVRQVHVAEDEAIAKREADFLKQKDKFNNDFLSKQKAIKANRERIVSMVRSDLGAEFAKQEQEDIEYYYTLQKEKDIQIENQEAQEKLDKKAAMESLMNDWKKITEMNKLIKEQEQKKENDEREKNLAFLALENKLKNAEERKKLIVKDINRMEIMFQINEREQQRQNEMAAKAREIKLLRAEGFVRQGRIEGRMMERIEDFKNNGLPNRFISNIKNCYKL